jgi:hypothetical protein
MKAKEKIKEVWTKHKWEIIGTATAIAGVVLYTVTVNKTIVNKKNLSPLGNDILKELQHPSECFFNFDNIDEAVSKFKEVESKLIELGKGEAALFASDPRNLEKTYCVMDLS